MTLEDRETRLLGVVEAYREQECRRLLEGAEQEARELLQQAYRKVRRHLHRRVVAERSRARARIEAAQAEQTTRERMSRERWHLVLLETAWPRLEKALLERWGRPDDRREWVSHFVGEALATVPRQAWTIQHAPDLDSAYQEAVRAELTPKLEHAPIFRADPKIRAGLIIRSGDAVLDATLDGLLADRRRMEARLLALLGREGEA